MRISIRWKLILAIGGPLLAIYLGMLAVMIDQLQGRTQRNLEEQAVQIARDLATIVDARLKGISAAAASTAVTVPQLPRPTAERLTTLARIDVGSDPMIHRARVVLRAEALDSRPLEVRVWRDGDGLSEAALRELDSRSQELAVWPESAGWTEPFSEDGALLVSYVAPIVIEEGGSIGAAVIDLSLVALREYLLEVVVLEEGGFGIISPLGRYVTSRQSEAIATSVSHQVRDAGPEEIAKIEEITGRMRQGEAGVTRISGLAGQEVQWVFFAPVGSLGWSFYGVMPESLVLAFSQSQLRLALGFMFVGLVLILGVVWLMATRITRPVARLAGAVAHLGTGDLETRVEGIATQDEIGELARGFNRMVTDLKTHVDALTRETAAREAVESEMRVGRRIQTSLLPDRFPDHEAFDLHAVNIPARQVAGDFYDFFFRGDGTLVILMADVSGKGVPAALFMTMARTVLRQACVECGTPAEAARRANEILEETDVSSMYVTLFLGWYEIPKGELRYVNAAHPPPWRIDARGQVTPFGEVTGSMVGILPEQTYEERRETLQIGDRLVLYTDGVPEAEGPDGEFLGDERFRALLEELAGEPVGTLCERLAEQIDTYQEGRRSDDVTLLAIARKR